MIAAFQAGIDIHTAVAAEVNGIESCPRQHDSQRKQDSRTLDRKDFALKRLKSQMRFSFFMNEILLPEAFQQKPLCAESDGFYYFPQFAPSFVLFDDGFPSDPLPFCMAFSTAQDFGITLQMRSLDRACRVNAESSCLVRLFLQRLDKAAISKSRGRREPGPSDFGSSLRQTFCSPRTSVDLEHKREFEHRRIGAAFASPPNIRPCKVSITPTTRYATQLQLRFHAE